MSQTRYRRPSSKTREPGARAGRPLTTGSYATNVQEDHTNKSSHKIPKNVRYQLENALLELCDIWFDEIKPHLVRNKVKVHTGGILNECGYGVLGPPKEEHRRDVRQQAQRRPPAIKPDSKAIGGELQNLLVNVARSIESALLQAAGAVPSNSAEPKQSL